MNDTFIEIGEAILLAVGGVAVVAAVSYLGFKSYEFFAPRYVAVDNKVFHESQAYNDGMIRDLENLQMEYVNADTGKRNAVRAIVLHRFSVYPADKMPMNLRNFYEQLKSENTK